MTPTADLMKLVEEMRSFAKDANDRAFHAATTPEHKAHLRASLAVAAFTDRLQAALTASCDARVGGEVVEWMEGTPVGSDGRFILSADFILANIRALATPAQPKASGGKAGGEAVAFAIQGPDGTISMLGWMPMRHREALQNLCVLTPGARFVYAYANLNLPETDDA